jgi:hypothetical protein
MRLRELARGLGGGFNLRPDASAMPVRTLMPDAMGPSNNFAQ